MARVLNVLTEGYTPDRAIDLSARAAAGAELLKWFRTVQPGCGADGREHTAS
jgi:hypothetical protein